MARTALFICGLVLFSAPAANPRAINVQLETEVSTAHVLVGHWRKTTIVFERARDEHLVLHADGTAENWVVTASSRTETKTGRWSTEGKTLHLVLGEGEDEISRPFTIHSGELIFPNIPNQRRAWEKIN